MSTRDLICIVGAVCGLIMVCGGIFLLYKGSITLKETPAENAVSIEFRRMFKLTTQYPALGIFVIGLAFVAIALYSSQTTPSLRVVAEIKHDSTASVSLPLDEVAITVSATSWQGNPPDTDGRVDQWITLPTQFQMVITAPGHEPYRRQIPPPSMLSRTMKLGPITLKPAPGIIVQSQPNPEHIVTPNQPIPSRDSPFQFN